MRTFKDIIMSMYRPTSKLTILRHYLKTLSMVHIHPKPIAILASAGSDTIALFLCKK